MERILWFGLAFLGLSALPATAQQSPWSIREFVNAYNSSFSMKMLLEKLPAGGLGQAYVLNKIGVDLNAPLPRGISFDLTKNQISFHGGYKVRFLSADNGVVEINRKQFQWNFQEPFSTNTKRILELLKPRQKSASVFSVFPQAYAQGRDFFPQEPSEETGSGNQFDASVMDLSAFFPGVQFATGAALRSFGAWAVAPGIKWWALERSGQIGATVVATYWGVNKAHALLAPACSKQVNELKQIMNENKIGLSSIDCKTIFNSQKSIGFWTPDGKKLPFHADWTESTVSIGNESYQFGQHELEEVDIGAGDNERKIEPGNPKFEDYKKNLEPYRQVLYVLGRYNSCYKCESAFKSDLVKKSPGSYSIENSNPDGGSGAVR